jgi:hypothetical protein
MVRVEAKRQEEYRQAYDAWRGQLDTLHRVFLGGEALEPPQLKRLLNREARAKERCDAARFALLGLGGADDDDPFGSST